MPELGPYGSVRGARGNSRPYRESRRGAGQTDANDPERTTRSLGADARGRRKGCCQDWKFMTVALAPVHGGARATSLSRQRPTRWSDIGRGQALC